MKTSENKRKFIADIATYENEFHLFALLSFEVPIQLLLILGVLLVSSITKKPKKVKNKYHIKNSGKKSRSSAMFFKKSPEHIDSESKNISDTLPLKKLFTDLKKYLKNNVNKAAAKIIPCNNTANNIILCGLLLGSVTPNMNLIFSKTILVETLPYPNKNLVVSLNISNVVSNNPMRPNMVAEPFVEKKLAITKVDDIKLTIDTVKNNFLE